MSLLVVGSVALDTIQTPFGIRKNILGGSATYFSVSARFFSPVNIVAVVGEDFPAAHINFLKNKGIGIEGLSIQPGGKTFRWEGAYSWDFNNAKTIATHLNVFADFNPRLPAGYRKSKYVFLANIDPQIQAAVLNQVDNPRFVACDTMNHWITNKRKDLIKFLNKVDLLFLNDAEARQLSGENNLYKAALAINKFGPKKLIIKKGEHGALLFSKNSTFSVPAFLLKDVVDPTGAGDTFAGAVMGYLAQRGRFDDATLRRALVWGNVMATFAVEGFSLSRLAGVNGAAIRKRLKEFQALVSF